MVISVGHPATANHPEPPLGFSHVTGDGCIGRCECIPRKLHFKHCGYGSLSARMSFGWKWCFGRSRRLFENSLLQGFGLVCCAHTERLQLRDSGSLSPDHNNKAQLVVFSQVFTDRLAYRLCILASLGENLINEAFDQFL